MARPSVRRGGGILAALSTRIACVLCSVVLAACTEERPIPQRVVLIVVDTLRADHLSTYGYRRPTTPVLDKLGAETRTEAVVLAARAGLLAL